MNPTATGTFTIPSSAAYGILRMRARTGFGAYAQVTAPCGSLPFGETEDYALNNLACPTSLTLTTNVVSGTVAQKASSSIQPLIKSVAEQ
jgi:hypothetical protein